MTDSEKSETKQDYLNARRIRGVLVKSLENDKESLMTKLMSNDSFDSPAYSALQANIIGQIKALDECITLLSEK